MTPHDTIEQQLQVHHQAQQWAELANLGLRHFGPELLRFAAAMMQSASAAEEVFAEACERIWVGLPGFRFESSFRTWAFTITRRLCVQHLREPHRRRARPLSEAGPLSELQAQVRTETQPYLRDEAKNRLGELRASLTTEEQAILTLRLDRGLSWSEIERVMNDEDATPQERKRREAALRKQFERLKERLRQLAKKSGLL